MARLGDLCDVLNGYAFRSEQYVNAGVRIIRIANVQKGYIEDSAPVFYPLNNSECKKYTLNEGDLLLSLTGNVGRVALLQKKFLPAALNQRVACLRIKDESILSKSFLFNFLNSDYFENKCIESAKGVAQKNMSTEWLKEYEIPLFAIERQEKISKELDTIGKLIFLRKQQLSKLDELVKSRFVEMFGSIKNNHQRYPVVKIGSCAKLQGGFAFKSSDYLNDGIRLVQISNVNKDTLDWDSINCVPQAFLQKYKDFELHVGDLVLAMTRPVIKSLDAVKIATVSENDVPSLLNQRVGRFVVDRKKLHSVYLMVLCQMPEFREYVEAMSGNSLQPNISSKQVEDYSIVLPPLALQEQFAAFVEHVNKSKFEIQKSLEKLETLKKALMQKYFG